MVVYLALLVGFFCMAGLIVISYSRQKFRTRIANEITSFCRIVPVKNLKFLEQFKSDEVPEPVKKYLARVLTNPSYDHQKMRLKQSGTFKLTPDGDEYPFIAEEYMNVISPAYIWRATIRYVLFLNIEVQDKYRKGAASVRALLEGVFTLANSHSRHTSRGALMRWAGEAVWYPAVFMDRRFFTWTAVNAHSAKAAVHYKGEHVDMLFEFDPSGLPTRVYANSFYNENGQDILREWCGTYTDWRKLNTTWIPYHVQASWILPEGLFTYAKIQVDEILFDPNIYEEEFENSMSLDEWTHLN